ncbi:uncharacterized protein LOC124878903 [Girardinichthys multiradiatus]|uniref:uncharacterized protein LOC124878903 n=1 Tax=Girardinichthys multiradiatus TaxID=208333 RepID=UPI001FAE194D|nr:uncharacterized protein LOC124878903 [Girardinichthys multiradiatus]
MFTCLSRDFGTIFLNADKIREENNKTIQQLLKQNEILQKKFDHKESYEKWRKSNKDEVQLNKEYGRLCKKLEKEQDIIEKTVAATEELKNRTINTNELRQKVITLNKKLKDKTVLNTQLDEIKHQSKLLKEQKVVYEKQIVSLNKKIASQDKLNNAVREAKGTLEELMMMKENYLREIVELEDKLKPGVLALLCGKKAGTHKVIKRLYSFQEKIVKIKKQFDSFKPDLEKYLGHSQSDDVSPIKLDQSILPPGEDGCLEIIDYPDLNKKKGGKKAVVKHENPACEDRSKDSDDTRDKEADPPGLSGDRYHQHVVEALIHANPACEDTSKDSDDTRDKEANPPGLSGDRYHQHIVEALIHANAAFEYDTTDSDDTRDKEADPLGLSGVRHQQSTHPVEKAEPIQGQEPEEIALWNRGYIQSKVLQIIFIIGSILFLVIVCEYLQRLYDIQNT